MAATFRSANGNNTSTSGTITITTPTGTVDGDMMVVFLGADTRDGVDWDNPPDLNTTNVFTTLYEGEDGSTHSWCVAYYEVSGTPAASYDFEGINGNLAGVLLTFQKSGGTWVTPVAGTHASATNGVSANATTSSLTANAGDAVACGFGNDGGRTISSGPSGMFQTSEQVNGTYSMTGYYQDNIGAGAFTKTLTYSTSDDFSAMCVLLRQSGGAGGGQPIVKRFGGIPGMAINKGIW